MTDDLRSSPVVLDAQVSHDNNEDKSTSVDTENEGYVRGSGSSDDTDDLSSNSEHESDDDDEDNDGDKGKGVATAANPGPWQAIYSPQHNSYYFYNTETQETTWTNPLTSSDPASTSTPESAYAAGSGVDATGALDPHYAALQQAAIAQGIDPALAYLDPSLASTISSTSAPVPGLPAFTAKFNARTGQFTRPEGREPGHLSEYERMKRMSEFYFDVAAWEQQLSGQGGSIKGDEASKKRKRPSKKDLERFKEQKRLKKIAKTAWLRT